MSEKYFVSISDLRPHIDPLSRQTWSCGEITHDEVFAAVAAEKYETMSWNEFRKMISRSGSSRQSFIEGRDDKPFHVNRIAYFVNNGLPLNEERPIMLGIVDERLKLYEGRHRMAAAFIRGDAQIEALIEGPLQAIQTFLPGAVPAISDTHQGGALPRKRGPELV